MFIMWNMWDNHMFLVQMISDIKTFSQEVL